MDEILDSAQTNLYEVEISAPGTAGAIPFTPETLIQRPSGDLFGAIQNVGMGWRPERLSGLQVLLLGTTGGISAADGSPEALGYHSGHYQIHDLMRAAAADLGARDAVPYAGFCTDPCDGRTQGTAGMMDSLAYRNDAAILLRRLVRSLPTRDGVMGFATCDKGLPAMMMALAAAHDLPTLLVPGGVTLPPRDGEDLGKIQSIGARFARGEVTLSYAREMSCRACASPGGGCQFLGTAATSQVVGEALGLALPHSALSPSGSALWLDIARRSAAALLRLVKNKTTTQSIITTGALHNAMAVFCAFGGSTNLLLHIPAIAHAAGLERPDIESWRRINRRVPRLVDALPNGPAGHPTVRVYLAGAVPEVMLHLRSLNLLDLDARTVSGRSLGENLEWWESSERRQRLRALLSEREGIDPDDVIYPPERARERGLKGTMTFPTGNLAPDGAVIKSTAIDPSVLDPDGVYRFRGPARVFIGERRAIRAIKEGKISAGDIMVIAGIGPMGSGMEEVFQITAALKNLSWGVNVAVLTDGRFSGVSTGACIGHIGPEALAGGPIGRVLEGDIIEIVIDPNRLEGSVDLIAEAGAPPESGSRRNGETLLRTRRVRDDLEPYPDLPDDTRLWAALQTRGGGTWGGCVYDVEAIIRDL